MSTEPAQSQAANRIEGIQPPIRGLILDGDGVLWKESEPIGDLGAVFHAIAARGLAVTIATNNAMTTVEDYSRKLAGFGAKVDTWQILTSAEATADTLEAAFPDRGSVYLVGERGVEVALQARGFGVVRDPLSTVDFAAVVVGIDRELTYPKLQKAATLIRQGLPYYGTNPDPTFPMPAGLVPGAGAILAAINAASGAQPVVIGKPSPLLFQMAARRMKLAPPDILVVGDRLETDIAGGQAFGSRTAVVLTGVSTREQALAWSPPPTIIAEDLSDVLGL